MNNAIYKFPDENENFEIPQTDYTTGGDNRDRQLLYQISKNFQKATKIDIIISFVRESGVKLLAKDIKSALDRGAQIRLLTGNYLGITQPQALALLKREFNNKIDLRFYNDETRSFHPKAYFFHFENPCDDELFIGSSNISKSALTSGIEWNYRLRRSIDSENYENFFAEFENLFKYFSKEITDEELSNYSKHWKMPAVEKQLKLFDEKEIIKGGDTLSVAQSTIPFVEPRGFQIEALYNIEKTRHEGATKALVCAATGVGKTFLAAFDSLSFSKVLFIAHQEQILHQAAESFYKVRGQKCGFFTGNQKDTNESLIFASVATLGRKEYLQEKYFSQTDFDYIVVDEFHHAVAPSYKNILEYFKPKFLLGLTATPERMDKKDIFSLCDYNVPFEINIRQAINKGLLVPFHYFGIYDDTDYSSIHYSNGKYDVNQLTQSYNQNIQRQNSIFGNYKKYNSKRALGFCISKEHAEQMAAFFNMKGIPSVSIYSANEGELNTERDEAIRRLEKLEINVIFSVNMFNEGVDVPSVDMVMFLRPTESPIIFMQQLGRGLRLSKNKNYLTVLDFIGNYKNASTIKGLLSGNNDFNLSESSQNDDENNQNEDDEFPEGCTVDFDLRLINLFSEMEKKSRKVSDLLKLEFEKATDFSNVYNEVSRTSGTRVDLFNNMSNEVFNYCRSHKSENPFNDYLSFLNTQNALTQEEKEIYQNDFLHDFIVLLETTAMTKSYKMPVLLSFIERDSEGREYLRMSSTASKILSTWKTFYNQNLNWKDFKPKLAKTFTVEDYQKITDSQHLQNIKKNPVNFLISSSKGYFRIPENTSNGELIALNPELEKYAKNKTLISHIKDILTYKTLFYYKTRYEEKE